MKRTTAILTAILMGSAVASYPAFAQTNTNTSNTTTGTPGTASNPTGDTMSGGAMKSGNMSSDQMKNGTAAGTPGSASNPTGTDDSMSGGQMSMSQTTDMLKTASTDSVTVVRMSDKANTDHSSAQTAPPTDTTAEEQASIQAAIEANPNLASMLKGQGLSASDIVAAHVGANNSVTLYTK